ncbi:hypothetical protein CF328_g6490, partial [Tilletia controversa]
MLPLDDDSPVALRTRSRSSTREPDSPTSPSHHPPPHQQRSTTPRRSRANSLPSSPVADLQDRRQALRTTSAAADYEEESVDEEEEEENPGTDPSTQALRELATHLRDILKVVEGAIPSEELSQRWRPLKGTDLNKIRASAQRGLAILEFSRPSDLQAPRQARQQQAQQTPEAGAGDIDRLVAATNKMQDDIKILTEALLSRPSYAQAAKQGTLQQQQQQQTNTNQKHGIVPPPHHPEHRITIKDLPGVDPRSPDSGAALRSAPSELWPAPRSAKFLVISWRALRAP